MNNYYEALSQIALSKSVPFCYTCYCKAPSGRCNTCGSDDLMLEYPGSGVEYGSEWIIKEILHEHLSPTDTIEAFEASIDDCYSETVKIGWIEVDVVLAIKELDPVSWEIAHSEFIDSQIEDEHLVTFDNGKTYYWATDIEQLIFEIEEKSIVAVD